MQYRTFVIFYLLVATLAYYVQTNLLFSPDVSYLLHAANVMLNGGKYGIDILETNPPLIMWLYFPVCLLAKWTTLDLIPALRLYILVLGFLSSSICFYLLKKIIPTTNNFLRNFLLCMLLFIFLFVPMFENGQREHLLTLLIMPYLFIVAAKLEKKSIPPSIALLGGVMAGLGFGLKPFFLVTLCLIELYAICKKRSIFAWLRIETLAIAAVLIVYLYLLQLIQPNYFKIILPLVLDFYFVSAKEPLDLIFSRPLVIFCFASIFSYFIFYRTDRNRTLDTVIWLALVGMTAAFMIPRSAWFYHTIPALSFAYLLTASYLGQTTPPQPSKQFNPKRVLIFLALCSIIYCVPIYNEIYYYTSNAKNSAWRTALTKLINFFNSQPGKHTLYCFTTSGTNDCFPLVNLTHSEFGSRYPFFWWFYGLKTADNSTPKLMHEKKYLIDNIALDLNHFKPRWIIVDTRHKQWEKMSARFIAEDPQFKIAWQHYHYLLTIDFYQIYARDHS